MVWTTLLMLGLGLDASDSLAPVVAPKPAMGRQLGAVLPAWMPWRSQAVRRTGNGSEPVIEDTAPERLPPAEDAAPLPPVSPSPALDQLLDEFLPEASAEERRAWEEELAGVPLEMARDFLAARSLMAEPGDFSLAPEERLFPPLQDEPPIGLPAESRRSSSLAEVDRESMIARLREIESVLLHNIANADTPGFRRRQPLTSEAQAGVAELSFRRTQTPGPLTRTDRPLDFAVEGPGYFRVGRGEAVALTRRGTFGVGAERGLVLSLDGTEWSLLPPVELPDEATGVRVSERGVVSCRLPGGAELVVGQIELVRVLDVDRLEPAGGGLLLLPGESIFEAGTPAERGFGRVRQGWLEWSNVDLPAELEALKRLRMQIAAFQQLLPLQLATPAEMSRQ